MTRLYRESELEAALYEECGSGNVLKAPTACTSCSLYRKLLDATTACERIRAARAIAAHEAQS